MCGPSVTEFAPHQLLPGLSLWLEPGVTFPRAQLRTSSRNLHLQAHTSAGKRVPARYALGSLPFCAGNPLSAMGLPRGVAIHTPVLVTRGQPVLAASVQLAPSAHPLVTEVVQTCRPVSLYGDMDRFGGP